MHNKKIRDALKRHNLFVYNLTDILKVSEMSVTRLMRYEQPEERQDQIVSLIEEAVKNGK